MRSRVIVSLLIGQALGFGWTQPLAADEHPTVRLAIHIHSTVSTGDLNPEQILGLAESVGLDGVVFTDSAIRRWEYGLWPLQNLVKWTVEQPSVSTYGPERYFQAVDAAVRQHPHLLGIPAVEVTPFYYWHRSPFDQRGGQIRASNNHLLVFGLRDPQLIRQLPLNAFDPYHGNQGTKPYQRLIDFVRTHGGVVYWAHPMAAFRAERVGTSEALVEPYPHLVELTNNHQGIALANPAALTMVEPGALWDQLLMAYGQGTRAHPVWILGELDWRRPQERSLDQVVTELRVDERTEAAVLRALQEGTSWVVFRAGDARAPALSQCSVMDVTSNRTAAIGGTLLSTGPIRITVSGERFGQTEEPIRITLIADGRVLHTEDVPQSHFDVAWTENAPAHATYYRIWIQDPSGTIYTNPIFVRPARSS